MERGKEKDECGERERNRETENESEREREGEYSERESSIRLELLAFRPDLSSPFLSPPTLLKQPLPPRATSSPRPYASTLAHHGTTTHLSSPPTNHTTQ